MVAKDALGVQPLEPEDFAMMIASTFAAALLMSGAPPVQNWNQNQRGAPRGSYAQSCSGAYVNQGRLYADCRNMRGQMRSTSIELARCSSSEIGNNDGRLVCGNVRGDFEDDRPGRPGQPGQPGRPGGGWGGQPGGGGGGAGAITVYRDSEFRGPSQSFNRAIENLADIGINDEISSIRLRGAWEVCSDAYFRGQCQVIDRDTRDLRPLGLNDRISSMRPAGRNNNRW